MIRETLQALSFRAKITNSAESSIVALTQHHDTFAGIILNDGSSEINSVQFIKNIRIME